MISQKVTMSQKEVLLEPNRWIDNYADYLFNYAVVRVNDNDIAKDLVQETFFAGLKSAKNFQGKSTERQSFGDLKAPSER